MAEIKSTMDLVMERAARMCKASHDDLAQETTRVSKRGQVQIRFTTQKIHDFLRILGTTISFSLPLIPHPAANWGSDGTTCDPARTPHTKYRALNFRPS